MFLKLCQRGCDCPHCTNVQPWIHTWDKFWDQVVAVAMRHDRILESLSLRWSIKCFRILFEMEQKTMRIQYSVLHVPVNTSFYLSELTIGLIFLNQWKWSKINITVGFNIFKNKSVRYSSSLKTQVWLEFWANLNNIIFKYPY